MVFSIKFYKIVKNNMDLTFYNDILIKPAQIILNFRGRRTECIQVPESMNETTFKNNVTCDYTEFYKRNNTRQLKVMSLLHDK